jgi:transglutaminase-like putative cysteine protease
VRWLHDVFGNSVTIASFDTPADRLSFESTVVIDRYPFDQTAFPIEDYARTLPFSYPASEVPDLGRSIERHYSDPERRVTEWTRRLLNPNGATRTEDFLIAATGAIRQEFTYEERNTPGVQSPEETLERGAGTCRDFAVFMMESVRSLGLAARFVSGYLYDPALDGQESETLGAGSTHAWVRIYLPGAGWLEFDPTNGSYGGHNLVPVAIAREPSQAVPVSGTYDGGPEDFIEMTVDVTVRAIQILTGVA